MAVTVSIASISERRDDFVGILKIVGWHTRSEEHCESRLRHARLENVSLVAVGCVEGRINSGELKENVPLGVPNLERVFTIVHIKWRSSAVRPERPRVGSSGGSHCRIPEPTDETIPVENVDRLAHARW
jgi:hypothetical protein